MKNEALDLRRLGAALCLATGIAASAPAGLQAAEDLPHLVSFELGKSEFLPGDTVTIQTVRGTADAFRVNETYCVEGTYTLNSADEADLALFVTTRQDTRTKVDPRQTVRVKRGTGSFRLVETMAAEGYPHVSFYPVPSGSSFGGVYFGQGDWLLAAGRRSIRDEQVRRDAPVAGQNHGTGITSSGANKVLFEYLGNPVATPAKLDAAYTPAGLREAVQSAAAKAGISLRKIEIDDSEFPFLVGVVSNEGDFPRLKAQLKTMAPYEYYGDVGSHSCTTFTIVPRSTWPADAVQRIHRRATLRMAVFYDKITSSD